MTEQNNYSVDLHCCGTRDGVTIVDASDHQIISGGKDKVSVDTGIFVPGVYKVNPYFVTNETFDLPNVTVRIAWTKCAAYVGCHDYVYTYSGALGFSALRDTQIREDCTVSTESLADRALLKALSKVGDSAFAAGVELGEIAETLHMLRHPFKNVREFFFNENHRRLGIFQKLVVYSRTGRWGKRSGQDAASAASSAWLEFRYGLMPLLNSIQDIIELVEKGFRRFNTGGVYCSNARFAETREDVFTDDSGYAYLSAACSLKRFSALSANASVQYRVVGIPTTAQRLGLTPEFLPEALWELTRLSFVLDWWLEVGNWLGSLRINPNFVILGNTVGHKTDVKIECYCTTWNQPGLSGAPSMPGNSQYLGSHRKVEYRREVDRERPLIPQFTELNPLDLFRAIDSITLLWQSLSGLLRKRRN